MLQGGPDVRIQRHPQVQAVGAVDLTMVCQQHLRQQHALRQALVKVLQQRIAPVQQPVRLPRQQRAALRLRHHGAGTLAVLPPFQDQISRVVIVIVKGKPCLLPLRGQDFSHGTCRDMVPVAGEKHRMNAPGFPLLRSGGQTGPQGGVILRCDLITQLTQSRLIHRHGASSFDGINITKEKELVMTEI